MEKTMSLTQRDLPPGDTEVTLENIVPGNALISAISIALFYNKKRITSDKKLTNKLLEVTFARGDKTEILFKIPVLFLANELYPLIPNWMYRSDVKYTVKITSADPFKKRYSVQLTIVKIDY